MLLAIINEIVSILFLFALTLLLFLIWRNGVKQTNISMQALLAAIDVGKQDAESARQSAESVRVLAAIIQNEQAKTK